MNIRFVILLILSVWTHQIFGQSLAGPERSIYIKLKAKSADILETDTGKSVCCKGVPSIDALNAKYKVVEMKRLFPSVEAYENKHRQSGLHLWYVLTFPANMPIANLVNVYKNCEAVDYAEPIYNIVLTGQKGGGTAPTAQDKSTQGPTNDPYSHVQWNLENKGKMRGNVGGVDIHLYGNLKSVNAANVIVAMVGAGADVTHPDLVKNIWTNQAEDKGSPNIDDDKNGYIDDLHGYCASSKVQNDLRSTAVAGLIAACNNNNEGIESIAGGSNGVGAKVMICDISGNTTNLPVAFVYAADNGAVICQADWHYSRPGVYNKALYEAVKYFTDHAGEDEYGAPRRGTRMRGGLILAPAGDENTTAKYYPQAFTEVISVAAITASGKKARYSNHGASVSISAPGGDADNGKSGLIVTTMPNSQYGYQLGTSLACAHVTGAAALLLEQYGNAGYSPEVLSCRLLSTASSLANWESTFLKNLGAGLLNVENAMTAGFPAVSGINLSRSELLIKEGEAVRLQAQIVPNASCSRKITWSSSSPNIASVNSSGLVKANLPGKIDIVASAEGGHRAVCVVEVVPQSQRPVSGIKLESTNQNIAVNEEVVLKASVLPIEAGNKQILWSSSKPDVVSVSTTGKIKGLKCGEAATVTASTKEGNYTANCVVTVGKKLTGIALSKSRLDLQINQVEKITTSLVPQDACPTAIKWKSSDPATVSVDGAGNIKSLACGSATVTAFTDNGFSNNCIVAVGQPVTGITLDNKEISLAFGEQSTLKAAVLPASACNKELVWKSDKPTIASIDRNGQVKGMSCGNATITVSTKDGDFKAECKVKVGMAVKGISLSENSLTLSLNQEFRLIAGTLPKEACNKNLKWTSSNPNFLTIDVNGKIKGVSCGTAIVSVETEEGNFTASCSVKIGTSVTGVTLQPTSMELAVNQKRKISVVVLPADACDKSVIWTSSNPAVVSVDNNGMVSSYACGKAVVSVSTIDGGFSAICEITVGRNLTGISLSPTSLNLPVNQEKQLNANLIPSDACELNVSWLSTDPSVVSVDDNGLIKTLSCGTSTIIVNAGNGFTAQCTVNVGKKATGVSLSRSGIRLGVTQEEQLIAKVLPEGVCDNRTSWVSNNPSVASVSQTGLVKGLSKGSSTIVITSADGSFTAECKVTVE